MTTTFTKTAAQGDVMFIRLPDDYTIPAQATKVEAENGKVVVAHSETGHHHVLSPDCTTMYRLPDSITDCLLVVERPDELRHLREFDTHEPIAFAPGKYLARRQREYTPDGWRRVKD